MQQNEQHEPRALLISVAEAARRVGLGRTKVYQLIDAGKFPHKRIGRCLRVPVKALETWAEDQGQV
jgi:excisionase family DNA binding protein